MTPVASQADRVRARALLAVALRRPLSPVQDAPPRMLVVDVEEQRIYLMEDGEATACYPVSTSAAGVGGATGSQRTPPGWHRIHRKIGAGAREGTVFESREPTGRVWAGEAEEGDLILTRILTLEGLEEGVNHGPGCDSLERYIYIHGTNHLGRLGEPVSHGCVRMSSGDVRELFEQVGEGDPVVILGSGELGVA